MILSVQTEFRTFFFPSLSSSLCHGLILFFSLSPFLQRAVVVSTSLPPRTFSALAVRRTASTTARAPGAATARTATTEPSLTLRLWPARVSHAMPLLGKHSGRSLAGDLNLNSHTCEGKKKHTQEPKPDLFSHSAVVS